MVALDIAFFVLSLVSLFSIINPLSAATVFISITQSNTLKEKRAMAKKSVLIAAIVLVFFALAGNYILQFYSITLEAFRIAGGILIGYVGFEMLNYGKKTFKTKKEEREAVLKKDVSIIPLAIPMMSGPGAITTSIVLMSQTQNIIQILMVLLAIVVVYGITYPVLYEANYYDKLLGENGRSVVEKITGFIVLVIGVQFVINGIMGLSGI